MGSDWDALQRKLAVVHKMHDETDSDAKLAAAERMWNKLRVEVAAGARSLEIPKPAPPETETQRKLPQAPLRAKEVSKFVTNPAVLHQDPEIARLRHQANQYRDQRDYALSALGFVLKSYEDLAIIARESIALNEAVSEKKVAIPFSDEIRKELRVWSNESLEDREGHLRLLFQRQPMMARFVTEHTAGHHLRSLDKTSKGVGDLDGTDLRRLNDEVGGKRGRAEMGETEQPVSKRRAH